MFEYHDLLGKEFKYGGRGPDSFDCYGLVQELYRRRGIELPEFQSFVEPAEIDSALNVGKQQFIQLTSPEPYCIATFIIRPPYVSHVGIVLPNLYQFIHIMRGVSVCIERLDSPLWNRRIKGYYKWPN